MAWEKIAFYGEVAILSDADPEPVDGTGAAEGTGLLASREDHVHGLGPLVANLDFAQHEANGLVLQAQAAAPDPATEVEAELYFDTTAGDKHAYVWIP
jgi:hypothetical protein